MKRTTILLACLTLLGTSLINAASNPLSHESEKVEVATPTFKNMKKVPVVLNLIPNASLSLTLNKSKKKIQVLSTGLDDQIKDWIIYQTDSAVLTRISTTNKIDEIKVDGFEKGQYYLMVKDKKGQALIQKFNID